MLTTVPPSCAERHEIWEPQPPVTLRVCTRIALPFHVQFKQQGDVTAIILAATAVQLTIMTMSYTQSTNILRSVRHWLHVTYTYMSS